MDNLKAILIKSLLLTFVIFVLTLFFVSIFFFGKFLIHHHVSYKKQIEQTIKIMVKEDCLKQL